MVDIETGRFLSICLFFARDTQRGALWPKLVSNSPNSNAAGMEKLLEVRDRLAPENPEFISVTYGAGGSTRGRTRAIVKAVQ
jgi:5,10-methylenetetrahydrofolate reductase